MCKAEGGVRDAPLEKLENPDSCEDLELRRRRHPRTPEESVSAPAGVLAEVRRASLGGACLALLLAASCATQESPTQSPSEPGSLAGVQPNFSAATAILNAAIDDRVFPGCAVAVGRSNGLLWLAGLGDLDYQGGGQVTPQTTYDLASLTKVVSTTSLAMALVRDGAIELESPLGVVFDRCGMARTARAEDPLRRAPVHALLTHTSGLPAWRPFYKTATSYEELVAAALSTTVRHPEGEYHYSDVGFILLGRLIERIGGPSLETLEQRYVFQPLGMTSTTRRPLPPYDNVAPTEEVAGENGKRFVVHGVVHDENARVAGGRTGHAGLFSTAEDIAVFAGALLRAARGNGNGPFDPQVVRRFLRSSETGRRHGRLFGWERAREGRSCGQHLSERAFGHTGFTGTSLWIDPELDLYIVLLSNRVHPSREGRGIASVRRRFADAVVVAVTDADAAPAGRGTSQEEHR